MGRVCHDHRHAELAPPVIRSNFPEKIKLHCDHVFEELQVGGLCAKAVCLFDKMKG